MIRKDFFDPEFAKALSSRIKGKTAIEIGAGVGFLAIEMARYAKHVWAVEKDPAWSWVFTKHLYRFKPKNLTWVFGDARDLIGTLKVDLAIVVTCSGETELKHIGELLAKEVIMPFDDPGMRDYS